MANRKRREQFPRELEDPRPAEIRDSSTAGEITVLGSLADERKRLLTDLRNAERIYERYGMEMLHRSGRGWFVWDLAGVWRQDDKAMYERVLTLGDLIEEEGRAYSFMDTGLAIAYAKWIARARNRVSIDACVTTMERMPEFNGDLHAWDAHDTLLNIEGGTIDLETGELSPPRPDAFLTCRAPVQFDSDAKCPRWLRFIEEVTLGDHELAEYLRWAVGLSATGITKHHVVFIAHGSGANGKSTFFNAIRTVLGSDYFATIDPEMVLASNVNHAPYLAALEGKRFVVASETNEGRRLNTSLIKFLTGGEPIQARHLYAAPFEFQPRLKLWIATNHRPRIPDDSPGMWRRIRLIPFAAEFKGADADPSLGEALAAETPGILNWILAGALRVHDGEPELPAAVRDATAEYKSEEDFLEQFIQDRCVRATDARCEKTAFLEALRAAYPKRRIGRNDLTRKMRDAGFADGLAHGGRAVWHGISLRAEFPA